MSRAASRKDTLVIILGGGPGNRLYPLTAYRAKPAVPVGGNFRLIACPISNALNSGLKKIFVVAQYEPSSLERTVRYYGSAVAAMLGEFINVLTPRVSGNEPQFFLSDGHSLVQLRRTIENIRAKIIVVLMADQLLKINLDHPIEAMLDAGACASLVYKKVSYDTARLKLGVIDIAENGSIVGFEEKPENPKEVRGEPGLCNANVALYTFQADAFFGMLDHIDDVCTPKQPLSVTGIPWIIEHGAVGYDLASNFVPGSSEREVGYFEDLGTLESYFYAGMNTCALNPPFNFYSEHWPILAAPVQPMSPAKIDSASLHEVILGTNAIIQNDVSLRRCIISRGERIGSGSKAEECIFLGGGSIGEECHIKKTVIDKGVHVPRGTMLSPEHLPSGTIKFTEIAQRLKHGPIFPIPPVLSEEGLLFIPKDYIFV